MASKALISSHALKNGKMERLGTLHYAGMIREHGASGAGRSYRSLVGRERGHIE